MTTFERKKIKKFNFFFMDAMKEVYEFNRSYMAYIKKFDIINTVYFSRFTVLYPIFPMPENKNLNPKYLKFLRSFAFYFLLLLVSVNRSLENIIIFYFSKYIDSLRRIKAISKLLTVYS